MFRKRLVLLILVFVCGKGFSYECDAFTYDNLVNEIYTDHVQHFAKLFNQVKVDGFIEFGLGKGTKYFLDHCDRVTSVEILAEGQSDGWFNHCTALYAHVDHWNPILFRGSSRMAFANNLAFGQHKDPTLYDSAYILEFKDLCEDVFKAQKYEVAFVDAGVHMRGELVNELFDRAEIIAAHDTNGGGKAYGWERINTPSNYVKIHCSEGVGVTFWVSVERPDVIKALGGTIPKRKKLRIFFPNIHGALVDSFARALSYTGHTLVLAGKTFDPKHPAKGFKLSYGSFDNEKFVSHGNVEVIENYEIAKNPPDVFFINCPGPIEKDINRMVRWVYYRYGKKSVKLAHHSGNNRMNFYENLVKNLVQSDAKTGEIFREGKQHIVTWVPWVDFDSFPFKGVSDEPFFGSYLDLHYFYGCLQGKQFFNEFISYQRIHLPGIEVGNFYLLGRAYADSIQRSSGTLHIKDTEGIGYTILDSLSAGRPVFLKRSFSEGSRMMNWCIEGKTAFFFDTNEELAEKMKRLVEDDDYRHEVQLTCAQTVRRMINNEKQARILDNFLQNLQ